MPRWEPTATGYRLVDGPCEATVTKVGNRWEVAVPGCKPVDLGRRASFDRAEAVVARLAAAN